MKSGRRGEETEFSLLIAKIYEAAANPSEWNSALRAMRRHLRTQSAMLFTESLESKRVDLSITDKASGELIQEYYDYYIHKSPLLKAKLSVPFGDVTATNMLMLDKEWERHEFYYDFLRRCERFYEMGALIGKKEDAVSVVSLVRSKRAGGYTRKETERLSQLLPHIRRALDIGRRIGRISSEQASLAALLDRLTMGVILFNQQARAVYLNRRAEELLADGRSLCIRQGEMSAQIQTETDSLLGLLRGAIDTSIGEACHSGGGMNVHRRGSHQPLKVLITPLRAETLPTGLGGTNVCAAMFLSEPGMTADLCPELLKELFSLTEAEALVVRELADGHSPQDISRRLNVSWHTVRTQQRAIYDKIGVKSQAQLVKAVLSSPAAISPPESRQ